MGSSSKRDRAVPCPDPPTPSTPTMPWSSAGPPASMSAGRSHRQRDAAKIPDDSWAAADALLVWHEVKIDAALVARLKNCRVIVRAGVGFDHIDLEAAGRAGIPVCNTPDYGTSEVGGSRDRADAGVPARHSGLSRPAAARSRRACSTPRPDCPTWRACRGRRIGIAGLGRIGTCDRPARQGVRDGGRGLRPLPAPRPGDRARRDAGRHAGGRRSTGSTWSACTRR